MNFNGIAIDQYHKIKSAINERVTALGYMPIHEEAHDAVFGSRHMIWSDNVEAMRFAWDGKEQWFCLEITEDLPLKPMTHWEEILVKPLDLLAAPGTREYAEAFLESLR